MAATDVITVAEAKEQLRISVATWDALIGSLVTAVSLGLERLCKGTYFVRRTGLNERQSGGLGGRFGGAKRMYLQYRPIVAVTRVEDERSTPYIVPALDYLIHYEAGILEHRWSWPIPLRADGGVGWWHALYDAGHFADTPNCAPEVKMAARLMVAKLFGAGEPGVVSKSIDTFSVTYANPEDLPAEVRMLLAGYFGGPV